MNRKDKRGFIYKEFYSPGLNKPRKWRYIAEIHHNHKRYRFRSTNEMNVSAWLADMNAKIDAGKQLRRKRTKKNNNH